MNCVLYQKRFLEFAKLRIFGPKFWNFVLVVFTLTQKVASKIFKETKHTDAFCFKFSFFIMA